ncbi:MAG TPA: LamG-like jellyroll fold domain-containing protein [Verrucomicrobiae bacterium]|jgi:O-glycosyl hydrolase|nr:LamG-like jellyroll fold domain-containing protein [Verrucomicrobiae bacterium]
MRLSKLLWVIVVMLLAAPAALRADYTATINPNSNLVTNFQGWGTSLCWWANVIGSYPNRSSYMDLAFTTLKLNIARYNIGGGQNPASNMVRQAYRSIMPGFEPTNGIWNWNADTNQRWVLQQARARGVNLVDAFANSPPWWMCVSSNVDGNAVVHVNNLQVNCEINFAIYLATVVSNLTILDGDQFNYLTPMNEPNGSKWSYTNASLQEGCNMSPDQQARVIDDVHAALKTIAPSVGIDAAEDVDPQQTYDDLTSYSSTSPTALGNVALITTHSYPFNGAANLKSEVNSQKKPLWLTEDGDSDGSGLTMARFIYNDIDVMGARAFCYWQVVDSAPGWGFLLNSLLATTNSSYTPFYTINEKFYVMGQFSEFIRPGCNIVSVNDTNTLAAWNPTNSTLVLVLVNNNTSGFNVTYNLASFPYQNWLVSATQTAAGKNMVTLPSPSVVNQQFTEAIPASSVTTFVLTTNVVAPQIVSQSPATNFILYAGEIPNFSLMVQGSAPFYYQWSSNGVLMASATKSTFTPLNIPQGGAAFQCVVSNFVGLATDTWSVTVVSASVASYPHTVLALNPIGFWPLNEAEQSGGDDGVVAADYAGGYNGIYTNVLLGEMSYDGLTDPLATSALFGYVATANSCVFNISGPDFSLPNGSNAEFTVSAWANSTGNNGLNTPTIAAKGYYYQEEYALDAGAAGCYRFSVRNAAGTVYNANSTISLTNSGQWFHLVGVCDEARGEVELYTNGVLAAGAPILTASGITNSSGTPMTIGARSSTPSAGFNQQFPGYIADVAIYNYPLSANQVQTLYLAGISLPSTGLSLTNLNGNAMGLTWIYGVLQTATNVAGPFSDITNVTPPYLAPFTNSQQYFRIREN